MRQLLFKGQLIIARLQNQHIRNLLRPQPQSLVPAVEGFKVAVFHFFQAIEVTYDYDICKGKLDCYFVVLEPGFITLLRKMYYFKMISPSSNLMFMMSPSWSLRSVPSDYSQRNMSV